MKKRNYNGWASGDFHEELDQLKTFMSSANRATALEVIAQTDVIVNAVEKSDMANGHGQKEKVYRSCINIYQKGYEKLGLVK